MSSFSQTIKDSLCESGLTIKKACCRQALLAGMQLYRHDQGKLSIANVRLLSALTAEKHGKADLNSVPSMINGCPGCLSAYLRGVFIACGSVADPESSTYQLQLMPPSEELTDSLEQILTENGMPPKRSMRSGSPLLYFKDSVCIEDFLSVIGAQRAAFELINTKIKKDLRNNANRLANCDAANIGKTVGAAEAQMEAVRRLLKTDRFRSLSADLQTTAQLRLDNPDATLAELAALHDPPITKSGVNHRLQRIIEISNQL